MENRYAAELERWRVSLDSVQADQWKSQYYVEEVYINDTATGVLLQLTAPNEDERPDQEADKKALATIKNALASGLRVIAQQLWSLGLMRPLLAVYYWSDEPEVPEQVEKFLHRLSCEDEWHQGDFMLRKARDRSAGQRQIAALLDDEIGHLDAIAHREGVSTRQVHDALEERFAGGEEFTDPHRELLHLIQLEIEDAMTDSREPKPDAFVKSWKERLYSEHDHHGRQS